jgi:hypothetical protein
MEYEKTNLWVKKNNLAPFIMEERVAGIGVDFIFTVVVKLNHGSCVVLFPFSLFPF